MAPKKGTGWTLEEEPKIRPGWKEVLLKMEDKIDWVLICFVFGVAILLLITAVVVTVPIEITFAIPAIALAYFSVGVAILYSKKTANRLLRYHSENTEKRLSELDKKIDKKFRELNEKIDDLSKKSKWRGKKKS